MPAGKAQSSQRGFTYLTVMALVAILGLGLAAIGPMWADAAQREREQELLRVGELYAKAIGNYRASSPGSVKRHPAELGDLLQDNRFVGTRRHLRKLYADPLNPARSWGLIRAPDGGVAGVYAQDERLPFVRTGLQVGVVQLAPAQRYSDWKFMPKETP